MDTDSVSPVLKKREVRLSNGQSVTFKIAARPNTPSFFLLGVRKSGSSIFYRIGAALAKHNDCAIVDIGGRFFSENVVLGSWVADPATEILLAGGNFYGGFRKFPTAIGKTNFFRNQRKILIVRDPRDALVSEYFSLAYSHSIPPPSAQSSDVTKQMTAARERMQRTEIDDAVRGLAKGLNGVLMEYASLVHDNKALILKYEDVVLDKPRLIGEICRYFGWHATDEQIADILSWADVVPTSEDSKAFVRKVVPGDHREKLSSETIAHLDKILQPSMAAFGYA